jgi:integrase
MATSIQQRGNRHQLRVTHKLLPKPFFYSFDTDLEARNYRDQLSALLARGIVPSEMLAKKVDAGDDPLVTAVIGMYVAGAPLTDSDDELLAQIRSEFAGLRVSDVTFGWADGYVQRLKLQKNLAPGTIRKRVGALARVLDWWMHREGERHPEKRLVNALRLLPVGYSAYGRADKAALGKDQVVKVDVQRDRRLLPAEEERVRLALAGAKRADRERALAVDPGLSMLFDLIVDTGARLREAYRPLPEHFDLERGVWNVLGSKGARGAIKPRVVPLKRELRVKLKAWLQGRETGRLCFPFWDGTPQDLDKCTARLTARFSKLFEYAEVEDFTEHDLRHEATCRWFELKSPKGGWVFSDIEICRIMGWTTTKMAIRYASLRGEDLADRLL